MRRRPQMFVCAAVTACAFLTVGLGSLRSHRHGEEQIGRYGGYTMQQIAAYSQPAVQALMGGSNHTDLDIGRQRCYADRGQELAVWSIDCSDHAGRQKALLLWNAETGELLCAGQWTEGEAAPPADAPSTQAEALALAWDWLHTLKIRNEREIWHVVSTHKKPCGQWDIQMTGGERSAHLTINTVTGKLVRMVCIHSGEPQIAQNGHAVPGAL